MKKIIIREEKNYTTLVTWEDGSISIYPNWKTALKGVGNDAENSK